jgi:hypothetical protein
MLGQSATHQPVGNQSENSWTGYPPLLMTVYMSGQQTSRREGNMFRFLRRYPTRLLISAIALAGAVFATAALARTADHSGQGPGPVSVVADPPWPQCGGCPPGDGDG